MAENDKKEYRNWYKTLKRIQKKELILFSVLILLAFIFIGISEKAYEWFKIIKIYYVLDNKPLINIPICIIISGFAIWWWTKIWKDKDIRPYRLGIIVFGLIVFIFIDGFLYANIVCNFSYQWFFIGLFSLLFIVSLIKIFATCEITWAQNLIEWKFKIFKKLIVRIEIFWKNKGKIKDKKNDNKTELKGFSVDNTEIKLEDNQIKYAETLVKKLKNTDLSKESFAVGITGEWGSGKSTFLNTMKKEIEEEKFAEIVEFNPWLCNSPEQVTQDFFATLIDKLSPKHSTLSRDLNKYAKLLNKIAKPSLSIFGIDLDLTPGDDSLDELKENISDKLAKLPKKVVILIDDTDRLEGNEIFEILRLIRNTADFKNVIYIATYDKEYVTDVLENKIKDPDNYLEKIFQLEVHLLKTRNYLLWSRLVSELNEYFQFDGIDIINSVEEQNLVLKVLTNYRQIKRFARHYITYSDYLNNIKLKDIDKKCLFWIELLQMYDKYAYDILAKDYTRLLNDSDDQILLHLKDKKDIKMKLKDETLNILNIMFPKTYKTDIQLKANYDKYFSLNISPFEVSMIEYITAISYNGEDKMNNAKETIYKWSRKKDDSIIARFINYTQYLNTTNLYENYILLILYFALIRNNFNKIKFLLVKEERNGKYSLERISKIIEEWFKLEINNYEFNEKLIRLSEFLNQMYHYITINGEGYTLENHKYYIDNEKIEELLFSIMSKLIDNNKNYSALDILQPRHALNVIFKNCCVQFFIENEDDYYEQIALDIVIEHFSKKENKPTFEEFDKVYKDNYEYDNMTNDERNKIDIELTKLFGSNYKEHIQTFKEKCFIQNKQTLNK